MNTIPTAEKFLKQYENITDHYADQEYYEVNLIAALQTFAKLHVKSALEAAYENATLIEGDYTSGEGNYSCSMENDMGDAYVLSKNSILESYPETNIK